MTAKCADARSRPALKNFNLL